MGLLIITTISLLVHFVNGFQRGQQYFQQMKQHTASSRTVLQAKKQEKINWNKGVGGGSDVEKYLKMKELMRLKEAGASYDELKEVSINGTVKNDELFRMKNLAKGGEKKGYQKVMGKGTLDQRLRSVIAYKRSTVMADIDPMQKSGMTQSEEAVLEAMMESDEDDDVEDDDVDDYANEEEAEYESLVLKAIENNKLNDVKKNLAMSLSAATQQPSTSTTNGTDVIYVNGTKSQVRDRGSILTTEDKYPDITPVGDGSTAVDDKTGETLIKREDDEYTPARSTWGVFKRPRDISKTFGGGRVITREEMNRMDAEKAERDAVKDKEQKVYLTTTMKKEKEYEPEIKTALAKSKAFMFQGNTKAAVAALESVKDKVGYNSDRGGEVLLELAMALETVERIDEAREIYGKLAAKNWNMSIRRNALQLISGLDIVKQIRSMQVSGTTKPVMDAESMASISRALEKGLRNEWDDYKKDKKPQFDPWLDRSRDPTGRYAPSAASLSGAYDIMLRELTPLKKVSNDLLRAAFQKLSATPFDERVFYSMYKVDRLLKLEKIQELQKLKQEQAAKVDSAAAVLSPTLTTPATKESPFGNLLDRDAEPASVLSKFQDKSLYVNEEASPKGEGDDSSVDVAMDTLSVSILSQQVPKFANGSWELMTTLTDTGSVPIKRFELGAVRRSINLLSSNSSATSSDKMSIDDIAESMANELTSVGPCGSKTSCLETYPTFWGMDVGTAAYSVELREMDNVLSPKLDFAGEALKKGSRSPWKTKGQIAQTVELLYCDEQIMITVERGSAERTKTGDCYTLWRRMKEQLWTKY